MTDSDNLLNRWQWLPIGVWSVVPPLLLLLLYHRRLRSVPSLNGAVWLFCGGMLAGWVATGLVQGLDRLVQSLPAEWALSATMPEQALFSRVLWQMAVVAPAAETCKFVAVVLPLGWLMRRYRQLPAQPSTVLLAAIAVALGMGAQMNWVALWYEREPVIDRLLLLPLQAIFSAPWGFALGFALGRLGRYRDYSARLIGRSWLAAGLCHGAWNGLWLLSRLPGQFVIHPQLPSLTAAALLYGLFPWALWLWWQTERMVVRSQGEQPPQLITGTTPAARWAQWLMAIAALGWGGAALYAGRDFGDSLQDTWALRLTFDRPTAIALAQELLRTIILGTLALYLFDRLRQANR
jgi:PrsW family intramembrane metalloprotease